MTTSPSSGLPGLRGTEHVGFTVPDLEEATRFFVDVIGCECVFEVGQFMADGDWMATHLNVDPRTIMRKLRFFRCKFGPNFEIFQYEAPGQKLEPPKNSDVGGHHLAFYVDDMDAAVAYLKSKGVRLLGAMDGTDPADLAVGQRVRTEFVRRDTVAAYRFCRI